MEQEQIDLLKQQLQQLEKRAALGVLSAGIAHEVQNPLNFVINFSKMSEKLLQDLADIVQDNEDRLPEEDREDVADIIESLKTNLAKIAEHGERAVGVVQSILMMSRGKENEFLPADVCKIVKEYVWMSYHALRANYKDFNIAIHEHYQEGLPPMMVIPQDLSRAVLNVMNNACYAVWKKKQTAGDDYQPEVTVSVKVENGNLVISFADNGEGMSEEVKQRIYENFFTTKPIGQGTGLGMGITRDIIENKHGGTMSFESVEGEGATFTFTLPIRK